MFSSLLEVVFDAFVLQKGEEKVRDVVRRVEAHTHQLQDILMVKVLHDQTLGEELVLGITGAEG